MLNILNYTLKLLFTTAGVVTLVACIIWQVAGVGQYAMIFFGVVCVYVGLFLNIKKKTPENKKDNNIKEETINK